MSLGIISTISSGAMRLGVALSLLAAASLAGAQDAVSAAVPAGSLLEAIAAHDLYTSLALIRDAKGLYDKDAQGRDPLLTASAEGCPNIVAALTAKGAPVTSLDALGNTALHLAAAAGQVYMAQMLCAKGIPVDCRNNDFKTPLYAAVETGQLEMVKALLECGADPYLNMMPDIFSSVPVMAAQQIGRASCRERV